MSYHSPRSKTIEYMNLILLDLLPPPALIYIITSPLRGLFTAVTLGWKVEKEDMKTVL
jgi:hypothetical protein